MHTGLIESWVRHSVAWIHALTPLEVFDPTVRHGGHESFCADAAPHTAAQPCFHVETSCIAACKLAAAPTG